MTSDILACQVRSWAPWHAVRPDILPERTFCGHKTKAWNVEAYKLWDEQDHRCKICIAKVNQLRLRSNP